MVAYLFLQGNPGAGNAQIMNLVFLALLFVVFYFFLIRPQNKRQREQRQFMDSLEKGQEVATAAGFLGKIVRIDNDIVTLELAKNVQVKVLKSTISKEMSNAIAGKTTESKTEESGS